LLKSIRLGETGEMETPSDFTVEQLVGILDLTASKVERLTLERTQTDGGGFTFFSKGEWSVQLLILYALFMRFLYALLFICVCIISWESHCSFTQRLF
jgi:hypothetical protein